MWRFVHLTDTHLGGDRDDDGFHRIIRTFMPDAIACLRRDLARLAPDFVLITGDIAAAQHRDAYFAARDLLDSFSVPYYPLAGNCDHAHEEGRRCFVEAFLPHLPGGDTHFTFTHNGLRFIALDPWWVRSDGSLAPHRVHPDSPLRWAVPPAQLQWLQKTLASDPNTPTVVACHYPVAEPEPPPGASAPHRGGLEQADALLDILNAHPQVRLYLCGHAHRRHIQPLGGVLSRARARQVVTAAFCEYPVEFRMIEVGETHLELTTAGLSTPRFAEESLVEANCWTAGGDEHRSLRLALQAAD